jgi:hypothetical protein
VYAEKILANLPVDLDVAALISAWLTEPLRTPWHFHLSRATGRLYFVHDELGVASSEHPDERGMHRLLEFATKVREHPSEGVRLLHAEISEIDSRIRKQLVANAPDFEGWLEDDSEDVCDVSGRAVVARAEIKAQRERLVKVLKQYVSRIGVPKVSLKTVAYERNAAHRKFIKSKQAMDSATWLEQKFDVKKMGSVLEKTLKYSKHYGDLTLKVKRSSMTQLTC